MFLGNYFLHIEKGNRVSVPSRFRKELRSFVFIAADKKAGCLSIIPGGSKYIPRKSVKTRIDSHGRIGIPASLRMIFPKSEVAFLGVGDCLEIWDKERWKNYSEMHILSGRKG